MSPVTKIVVWVGDPEHCPWAQANGGCDGCDETRACADQVQANVEAEQEVQ